jgi:PAS domain S-box-containing protein
MSASRELLDSKGVQDADGPAWPLLAAALDESGDGLTIVRVQPGETAIVFCNRAFTDLTGFAAAEALRQEPFFLCGEPLRGQLQRALEEVVTTGEPQRRAALGNRKNGGVFFARVVMRRLAVPGIPRYVALTFVDVSDLAEIDAALRQLPTAIVVFAPDMTVRFANEAAARSLGLTVEEFVGRNWFAVLPGAERRREFYTRVLAGESLDFQGVPFNRPDGSLIYVDSHLRPQRDATGRITGVVSLVEDVTAQHLAMQRLEASEQWLRAVTENSHDIIVVLAADGCIKSVAGNFLEVFGVPGTERIGRSALDFIHREDLPRVARNLESLAATPGERARDEFRLSRPDGTVRWVDVSCLNMLDDPTVKGIVINLRDGTMRKNAETALADARKHLDLAVACAGLALWDCDVSTRKLVWNDEWYRILGVDPAVGRRTVERMEDGVHPDDVEGYMLSLEECWRGPNDRWERQMRVRTAHGTWKWIFDRGRVVERDASGHALRMAGVSIDIDAVKKAEAALKETESRLAVTLWGTQVGFWEMRTANDAIEWWNDWCGTIDIDPCAGPNHSPRWDKLTHPDDLDHQVGRYNALVDGRADSYEAEYRMQTRSGEWRWLLSRGRAVERDASGRATRIVGVTIDIDARKRAELALREAEQRLELAIQGAQLPVWDWDMKHDQLRSNHYWYRALGVDITPSDAERREEHWLEGVHPDDADRMRAAVAEHVSGRKDFYEVEYRFATADGNWKWLLDRGKVVEWDENGAPGRMSGVAIDIDERKRMETALLNSEAQLEAAVWGADLGLFDWDIGTDTCQWLSDWCSKFDFEPFRNSHYQEWLKRMHPEDLAASEAAFEDHVSGRCDYYEAEYRLLTKSDTWRWVHERGRVMTRDANGRAARVVGVCFDIDARRRVERNLHETQARLELTVWGSQIGFWDWNLVADDTRWINDWCRTLELDPCDGANHVERWDERIHPDDLPDAQVRFDKALRGASDFYESEYRVLTLSGRWHWIHERGRVVERDANGRALRMAGICMDINARKRTELALRETEARLGTALWSAGIAYWDWDLVRDTCMVSEHWFAMTGYSRGAWEQEQDPWRRRVHPDDLPAMEAAFDSHVTGRTPTYEFEYRLRIAAGDWKWMLDRGRIVERDAKGIPTKMAGTSIDIDARKRTERELEASEYRYRTVAALSPGFIQELVPVSGGGLKVKWVSEGFEQIFALKVSDLSPIDAWRECCHPDDRTGMDERRLLLLEGRRTEAEFRVIDKRNEIRWLHAVSQPFADPRTGQVTSVIGVCHDITDRKVAEQALRESEYRYRTVAHITPGFVQELKITPGGEAMLTWVSDGFRETFGCSLEEMQALGGPHVFYHPEDVGQARERIADLAAGRTTQAEVRMVNARGETRWLHVVNQPMSQAAAGGGRGDAHYVIGVCHDITARKNAELALQKSESILRSVTDNVPDWLLLVDLDLRCRFANREFLGRAPAEFVGGSVLELAPAVERERLSKALDYAIRTANSISSELTIEGEAEQRHFEMRAAPVIEQGVVAGLTVAITEITQRKIAETTLRTQATILETMREGVAVIGRDGTVRLTNPAFDRMFGCAPGEVVGMSVADLLGEVDFAVSELNRLDVLERHRRHPLKRDFLLRRRDGSIFTGEAVMTSLELGDERVWLAVVQDITERKGLEHEIIEIANREQQRIGSDLHDGLGQELTGIALMLRGLTGKIRKSDATLTPYADEIVALVNHTIESARALARGLSPVSLDRGGLVFALRSLASRAREMYGVNVRLRSRIWPELTLDEPAANHLYRIAQEAVTNAVRHGQASQVTVQLLVEERTVRLTISDNGAGLPATGVDGFGDEQPGMGLKIMAYRARMIDGVVTVERLREGGTRVRCRCRQPAPAAMTR